MAETYSARLTPQQEEALEAMSDNGDADNTSEALRMALDEGLIELGYRNGAKQETRLRATIQRFADAFGLLGIIVVGVTWLYPLGFRMWAIPIFLIALTLYGLDRLLADYEPDVSNRICFWREA